MKKYNLQHTANARKKFTVIEGGGGESATVSSANEEASTAVCTRHYLSPSQPRGAPCPVPCATAAARRDCCSYAPCCYAAMLLRDVGYMLAAGYVLAASRVAYPQIHNTGFPYIYEGVIRVGDSGKKITTEKNRVGFPVLLFFYRKTDGKNAEKNDFRFFVSQHCLYIATKLTKSTFKFSFR